MGLLHRLRIDYSECRGIKPNISTIVGGLYKQGDPKRDMGFSIFYMGINVGALLSAVVVVLWVKFMAGTTDSVWPDS